MTYKTHLIGGAQAGVLLAYFNNGTALDSALLVSAALIGSVIPDIDHTESKVAKADILGKGISKGLSRITDHRGFTHTIPGAIVFSLFFILLGTFRTGRESAMALWAFMLVFGIFFLLGKPFSELSGIMATLAYIFTPLLMEHIGGRQLSLVETGSENNPSYLLATGMFAGCLMHMIYDSFTKGGVPWLWPITKKRYRIANFKTNTPGEVKFRLIQILILMVIIGLIGNQRGVWDYMAELIDQLSGSVDTLKTI